MDKQDICRSLVENMLFQASYFANYLPSISVDKTDVFMKYSSIKDDTYNMVMHARFSKENAEKRIDEIISFYQLRELPFSWWVGEEDTPLDLSQKLIKKGFQQKEVDYGMYLDLQNYIPLENKQLLIKQVLSTHELEKVVDILIASGENPDAFSQIYSQIPSNAYNEKAPYRFYIGMQDNKSTVCGALVFHGGVVGIYYIVTHPDERRKGYATEMMHVLLKKAKDEGYSYAILQASEDGKKVYEKMGFIGCCAFHEYVKL
jgi:GNAT superfamily N-acetyltransferase